MKRVIIKKVENYSEAIFEQAFYEELSSKYDLGLNTMIMDSRDINDGPAAFKKFGVMILDDGLYLLVQTNNYQKLALALEDNAKNFMNQVDEESARIREKTSMLSGKKEDVL